MAETADDVARRIEALVQATLRRYRPRSVWVGFSGGVDSTALLLACQRVVEDCTASVELVALHVNHGVDPASVTWQEHCRQVCATLGVELRCRDVTIPGHGNFEANARRARYDVFAANVAAGSLLLLGHHQRDQTETILYRLFEGRGLLPMRSEGRVGEGWFARPLLALAPEDLVSYVEKRGFGWVEDRSNADVSYARNFLRREILPPLVTRWRGLHDALQRVVSAHGGAHAALAHELRDRGDEVTVAELPTENPARVAWLRAYLSGRSVYHVSDRALAAFCDDLGSALAQLDCGARRTLYGYDGTIYFVRDTPDAGLPGRMIRPFEELELAGGHLRLRPARVGDELAMRADAAFSVGFRAGSERLRVAGSGQTKTLKQLFNAHKVPPWRRAGYPLLYVEQALVCVPGIAVAVGFEPSADAREACVAQWII